MKKNKWKKILISVLPLLVLVVIVMNASGIFEKKVQIVENVRVNIGLVSGDQEIGVRFTKFEIAKNEALKPIKEQLEESLKNSLIELDTSYQIGVQPNDSFQLISYSDSEDPYTFECIIDNKKIELDEYNKGVFPDQEGTFSMQIKKQYADSVKLTFEGKVCITKDELKSNIFNVGRMISEVRVIDQYNFANAEGYEVNHVLFGIDEAMVLQAKEKMIPACIANLSDGKKELLSDYVLCRWIAEISGIGTDYDSWEKPSDYRKKYLQKVIDKYEINMDRLS